MDTLLQRRGGNRSGAHSASRVNAYTDHEDGLTYCSRTAHHPDDVLEQKGLDVSDSFEYARNKNECHRVLKT